ncbi:radical SAM protein [Patescibacteria group bacterium]|nr:radical SAM protein [Patescibacteria group bacterium]
MDCQENTPRLEVETDETIYEIEFGQVQIEITGRCNMSCQHCRASHQVKRDMPIEQIVKIMKFARQFSPNYKEVILSGGEPLLHNDFTRVLQEVRHSGGDSITLTTNGYMLDESHLDSIRSLEFERFVLSVSIDNLRSSLHDEFRMKAGAFDKAVNALKMVAYSDIPHLIPSMRSTIQAQQIAEMEEMVVFADTLGCKRVSFSAIHPAGKAITRDDLWMNVEQKRSFLKEVYRLKEVFPHINVTTNDPLKCLLRGKSDLGHSEELVFDGCGAAAITFNVDCSGNMTPCALLNIPMMNTFALTIEEMNEAYSSSDIVRNMLEMNLSGKCGACELKYQCGGCRARALIQNGDYLAEDSHCWINV